METQNQDSNPIPPPAGSNNNTLMGILSYLGILVVIPLLGDAKNDPFVKFHAKQGLVLLICEIIIWTIASSFYGLWMFMNLVNLVIVVLAIMGIINVTNGSMKELPVVGQLAKHFNF